MHGPEGHRGKGGDGESAAAEKEEGERSVRTSVATILVSAIRCRSVAGSAGFATFQHQRKAKRRTVEDQVGTTQSTERIAGGKSQLFETEDTAPTKHGDEATKPPLGSHTLKPRQSNVKPLCQLKLLQKCDGSPSEISNVSTNGMANKIKACIWLLPTILSGNRKHWF